LLDLGREFLDWTVSRIGWAAKTAVNSALGCHFARGRMIDTNVKRPNDSIGRQNQFGMIEQVLKVVELPFANVILRIVKGQVFIDDGERAPNAIPVAVQAMHVRARFLTSIQQDGDIGLPSVGEASPPGFYLSPLGCRAFVEKLDRECFCNHLLLQRQKWVQ
jgi:hypothetical protein